MKPIPRKVLIVERPDEGYNLMIEYRDRSHCYQVSAQLGERVVEAVVDAILATLVQFKGRKSQEGLYHAERLHSN